jgi:hypothetical protein
VHDSLSAIKDAWLELFDSLLTFFIRAGVLKTIINYISVEVKLSYRNTDLGMEKVVTMN